MWGFREGKLPVAALPGRDADGPRRCGGAFAGLAEHQVLDRLGISQRAYLGTTATA